MKKHRSTTVLAVLRDGRAAERNESLMHVEIERLSEPDETARIAEAVLSALSPALRDRLIRILGKDDVERSTTALNDTARFTVGAVGNDVVLTLGPR